MRFLKKQSSITNRGSYVEYVIKVAVNEGENVTASINGLTETAPSSVTGGVATFEFSAQKNDLTSHNLFLYLNSGIPAPEGGSENEPFWNLTQASYCYEGGTRILLEVINNSGHMVEFSTDYDPEEETGTWLPATTNTQGETNNARLVDFGTSGTCEPVFFRILSLGVAPVPGCILGNPACEEEEVNPQWATGLGAPVCENGNTKYLVEVVGNGGHQVQFSLDYTDGNPENATWLNANVSTRGETNNARYVLFPSNGQCNNIYFQIPAIAFGPVHGCLTGLVDCLGSGSGEAVPCEFTPASPHDPGANFLGTHHGFFARDKASGLDYLMGTFFSEYGEYYTNAWKRPTLLGTHKDTGKKFVGYKEPYTQPYNVHTRTKAGCYEGPDGRTTEINSNFTYSPKTITPGGSPPPYPFDFEGVAISLYMGYSGTYPAVFIYEMLIHAPVTPTFQWRFEGQPWSGVTAVGDNQYSLNGIGNTNLLSSGFYIDFTFDGGATFERFAAVCTTNLGHFATSMKLTRCSDSNSWVTHFMGDRKVDSILRIAGVDYQSGYYGCCYEVGNIGTVKKIGTIIFPQTNITWLNIEI